MSNPFALSSSHRIIHISEVERGLNCHCLCLVCGERMVAKKGEEREHHFAHESNKIACEIKHETLLHQFAKRVIQESGGLTVPPAQNYRLPNTILISESNNTWLQFERIEEEKRFNDMRPDLIGYSGDTPVLIEVAYSSFVGADKMTKIENQKLFALEIDLSEFHPENFDLHITREAILSNVEQKQWLYCPEPESIFQKPEYPTDIVTIKGIWVYLRSLPSGDLAIKVSVYNPEVNSIVKSIAKRYSGYWHQPYKNWIVPRRCFQFAKTNLHDAADLT